MSCRFFQTVIAGIAMAFPAMSFAQDRSQARSMTITQRGIVGAEQTLAAQAGAQILARGGSPWTPLSQQMP